MRKLIVNADDYGLTPGVSRGILQAHLAGIVTSTTAMLNRPGTEAALRDAVAVCPHLGLGVHLTLTSGRPLLRPERATTLVDANGNFFKPAPLAGRIKEIDWEQVRDEWRAQIERFCTALGRPPDHLDSHHHISYASAEGFGIMLDLASAIGCPIRAPSSDDDSNGTEHGRTETHAVRYPDHLRTLFYDDGATLENLLRLLHEAQEGVTEVMTHPGYTDASLIAVSSYNHQRERELLILTDPRVLAACDELGVTRVRFEDAT